MSNSAGPPDKAMSMKAEKQDSVEDPEGTVSDLETVLRLPNGRVCNPVYVSPQEFVGQVKASHLNQAHIPNPNEYEMLIWTRMSRQRVMDDGDRISRYIQDLADGADVQLEIRKREQPEPASPSSRAIRPDQFNVSIR